VFQVCLAFSRSLVLRLKPCGGELDKYSTHRQSNLCGVAIISDKQKTPISFEMDVLLWLPNRDSNPNKLLQRQSCYRYTIRHRRIMRVLWTLSRRDRRRKVYQSKRPCARGYAMLFAKNPIRSMQIAEREKTRESSRVFSHAEYGGLKDLLKD
jgi:hypothetical protein